MATSARKTIALVNVSGSKEPTPTSMPSTVLAASAAAAAPASRTHKMPTTVNRLAKSPAARYTECERPFEVMASGKTAKRCRRRGPAPRVS